MKLKRITSLFLIFILLFCNTFVFATIDLNDCEYNYECFEICGVHILCKIFNSISNVWETITGGDPLSAEVMFLPLCIFIFVFIILNSINYILKKRIKVENNKESKNKIIIIFSKILNVFTYIYSIYLLFVFVVLLFLPKALVDNLYISLLMLPIVFFMGCFV